MFFASSSSSTISAIPPISKFVNSSSSSSSHGKNSKPLLLNLPPASRIFLSNLSYTTGEASLIKLFSKFGQIVEVKLAKHEDTKRSKGYAFIQYNSQDDAILAIENMDEKMVDGRMVHAAIAKPSQGEFGAYPKSLGPPPPQRKMEANAINHNIDEDDCWY